MHVDLSVGLVVCRRKGRIRVWIVVQAVWLVLVLRWLFDLVGPEIQIYDCVGERIEGEKWKGTDHFSRDKIMKKKKISANQGYNFVALHNTSSSFFSS